MKTNGIELQKKFINCFFDKEIKGMGSNRTNITGQRNMREKKKTELILILKN